MKKYIALLLSALVLSVATQMCRAQSFESQSASIAASFNARNAALLAEHFCASVELLLPGVDDTFSKVQAKGYVADFFGKIQPHSFEIVHQGSRANVCFIVGNLTTATKSFRVNMLFKKEGDVLKIYQLRIE